MGIGAAVGVGASGAGIGAAIGGPVGAAIGGLVGVVMGAFVGGGDTEAAVASAGTWSGDMLPTQQDPSDQLIGSGITGGPSTGGLLAPPVETTSSSVPTAPPPASAPFSTQNVTAPVSPGVLLNRARGNFMPTRGFTKAPLRSQPAPNAPRAYTPSSSSPQTPQTPNRPPVETVENSARDVAAHTSRIPSPNPKVGGSLTSQGALRDAVQQSFQARSATLTTPGAVSRLAAGASERSRTNVSRTSPAGPTPTRPAPLGATNTPAAPVEALENVKSVGERMSKDTADRFQGIAGAGRSNLSFKPRP